MNGNGQKSLGQKQQKKISPSRPHEDVNICKLVFGEPYELCNDYVIDVAVSVF